MNTMLVTVVIYLTLFIDTILGTCTFPSGWTDHQWFVKFDADSYTNYYVVDYTSNTKRVSRTGSGGSTVTYGCNAQYSQNGMDYYTSTTAAGSYFCHQTYYYAGFNGYGLLTRKQELSTGLSNAESCSSIIVEYQPAYWEVLVPTTLPDAGINCPIPTGEHDTAFTVPGGTYCVNDPSTLKVYGDTIEFNLCRPSGVDSSLPLSSKMTCLSTAPGDFFDGSDSSGDVLLLADLTSQPFKFYCARYRTVQGRAYMSLNLGFEMGQEIKCESDVSYTKSTAGYMAVEIIISEATNVIIPNSWKLPTKWHYYYLAGPIEGAVQLIFQNENAYFTSDNPDVGQTSMHTILDSYTNGNRQYFLYMSSSSTGTMCWEFTTITPNILTERIAPAISNSASDCSGAVSGQTQYHIIVKDTDQSLRVDMPFTEGTYWTIFTEGGNDRDHCRDNSDSLTTIAGPTMITDTCENTDTYSRPYKTTLYGIVAFSAGMIDPSNNGNGDWLILSRYNEAKGREEYYCSRYKSSRVNNNREIIRLSLNVDSSVDTYCDVTTNYETNRGPSGESYRAFLFETTTSNPQPTTPTTKGPTTTPSTVDTPSTTTTQPDMCGGCVNGGICAYQYGEFRCNCPHSTTGSHCETVLPLGFCQNDRCNPENTQKCEDSRPTGYYYCECKDGYSGPQCNDDECNGNPCKNGGTCQPAGITFVCICADGYTGSTCNQLEAEAATLEADDLSIIIGLTIGLALLLLAVVIVGVLICQFRNKEREANSPKADGDMMTGGSVQAWYPDYSKDKNGSV